MMLKLLRVLMATDFSESSKKALDYAADEVSADMVVLGARGRTGLDRFMMGSVAEHVAREASCPVLIA